MLKYFKWFSMLASIFLRSTISKHMGFFFTSLKFFIFRFFFGTNLGHISSFCCFQINTRKIYIFCFLFHSCAYVNICKTWIYFRKNIPVCVNISIWSRSKLTIGQWCDSVSEAFQHIYCILRLAAAPCNGTICTKYQLFH